jgi:hypothetical protein
MPGLPEPLLELLAGKNEALLASREDTMDTLTPPKLLARKDEVLLVGGGDSC